MRAERIRRALTAALLLLPMALSPAAAQESLDPGRVEAIEGVVRDYLRKNPEVVIEAIRAYQAEQRRVEAEKRREAIARFRGALENDPGSYVGGNPEGNITLVEFFDYRCPYCKRVGPALLALRNEDRDLRIVFKEFPILGPESLLASRAAIASRAQDKYEPFHDALMSSKGKLDEKTIIQIATEVGLDIPRLIGDMASPEVAKIIEANHRLGRELGVDSTPSFVIGDELVKGAIPLERLKSLIADARANCLTC